MQAVPPDRSATKDMGTNRDRLYVALAKQFVGSGDIVALSIGCVAEKWPLRVIFPCSIEAAAANSSKDTAVVVGSIPNIVAGAPGVGC